jgi:RTX calcium-binding nonapeptide repeat (4 copies)/Calx-beta domain
MAIATAREQLLLELVNRARLDPVGEAARFGIDLNEGLPAGTIDVAPNQVLAFNSLLNDAADAHSQWMIDNDKFQHGGAVIRVGPPEIRTTSRQRMETAGFNFGTGSFASGENLAINYSSGAVNGDLDVVQHHEGLMLSSGHRTQIMNEAFKEVGLGSLNGLFKVGSTNFNATVTTQNFAMAGNQFFVTGVTYNDAASGANNDDFYSIGEGIAGRNVQLTVGSDAAISMVSQTAGGFALGTATAGQATIAFSGAGLTSTIGATFSLNGANVKIDMVDNNTILSSVTAELTANTPNLTLIGVADVGAFGNDQDNILTGNKGNNNFNGNGGNDTVRGGAGSDTASFEFGVGEYQFNFDEVNNVLTVVGDAEGTDTFKDVEFFDFGGTVMTLAEVAALETQIPTVSIAAVSAAVAEGNSGSTAVTFTLALNPSYETDQTVQYTVAGSGANAANAADFIGALSGTVTFLAGTFSQTITVNIAGDLALEANETFSVTLSNPSSDIIIGTAVATMNITNDELPPTIINGTKKADNLIGTEGQNTINGLTGNDVITGLGDNDVIDGGKKGTDTSVYRGASADYVKTFDAVTGKFTISGGIDGVDTVSNVELFQFTDGTLTGNQIRGFALDIKGTSKGTVMNGTIGMDNMTGQGGNDIMNGGAANDRIDGGTGNDTITGGAGVDTFRFTDKKFGLDTITDFTDGEILSFSTKLADNISDFVITNNGTNAVTVTLGLNSVVVQGTAPITLDAGDFFFG